MCGAQGGGAGPPVRPLEKKNLCGRENRKLVMAAQSLSRLDWSRCEGDQDRFQLPDLSMVPRLVWSRRAIAVRDFLAETAEKSPRWLARYIRECLHRHPRCLAQSLGPQNRVKNCGLTRTLWTRSKDAPGGIGAPGSGRADPRGAGYPTRIKDYPTHAHHALVRA